MTQCGHGRAGRSSSPSACVAWSQRWASGSAGPTSPLPMRAICGTARNDGPSGCRMTRSVWPPQPSGSRTCTCTDAAGAAAPCPGCGSLPPPGNDAGRRVLATRICAAPCLDSGKDQVLIAPRWPGVHAMLDKRAPTYHDYMMWPTRPEGDRELINDLDAAEVRWAMINNRRTGDRTFRALYPQTMDHIRETFEEVEFEGQPSGVHIFRRDLPDPVRCRSSSGRCGGCTACGTIRCQARVGRSVR